MKLHPSYAKAFTDWIVISEGEGHQSFRSRQAALAEAERQAAEFPGLVLAVYRLKHLVRAKRKRVRRYDPDEVSR